MNAIEISGLTKTYPGFSLGPLNLALPSGCILGLIGENGAGKTTMLKLILNSVRRDGGTVKIFGQDNSRGMELMKEDIGVVTDEAGIPDCLTAKQVGRVMAGIFKNWDGGAYASLLSRLALPEDKRFKEFSRGMKMKLGIAIAMSHHAKLLLLDEPTSGLDPVVRDEVVDMFMDFTRDEEHSILISSHIVSDLEKLCDYVAFLHKGRLMLLEEKDRLLDEYGLIRCAPEELAALPAGAVKQRRDNPYGCEALVDRRLLPPGQEASPISIEELFVFMVKEAAKE